MEIRYPAYYNNFRCIASACPDSCCKEWDVDVDPEAAARYRTLPGALGDRLRAVLRDGEDGWAAMTIVDGRCPMWRDDGLCSIQAALGHEALCTTCREFPRLRHDYGNFAELGLELSCPEAVRLILSSPATGFLSETVPGGEPPDYDEAAMDLLLRSRTQALAWLRDDSIPLGQALAAVLLYGYDVHDALSFPEDYPEAPEISAYLSTAALLARPGHMAEIFALHRKLEILTPRWRQLLEDGPVKGPWLPEHRRLACYLADRYWLQAVSDLDLLCRAKFITAACLTVKSLPGDVLQTAQLWSKEIENDADNVEALLTAAYTSPALADVKLLDLLMQ